METTNPNVPADAVKGPLAFLIASLVLLCLSAAWLAWNPALLTDSKISPESIAWVYLAVYGFALSGVFGLVYRSVPLVFGMPLYSPQFVILHFVFHVVGLLIVILSAFFPESQQGVMGQTFLACGAVVFIVNISGSFKREDRPDASAAFLATSMLWLAIMIAVGLPFAQNPLIGFFANSEWSLATLELCIVGVVVNAILGLALRLTSMRVGSSLERTNTPWFALALVNAGAAWVFAATAFGPPAFVLFCAGIYLSGVMVYIARFTSILQSRADAGLEWDSKILYTALWMLPVCVILFGFAIWTRYFQNEPSAQLEASTLLAIVLGVCVPGLVALFYQTATLLRGDSLDEDAPFDVRLSAQILLAAFFNYAVGVLMVIPGAWLGIEKMLGLGTLFIAVGAIGFLCNFLYMLRPKSPSQAPAAAQTA
ncbi:MAG: hypothetical protein ACOYM3_12935 [Terrimicrobiaceae bacterium]